MQEYPLPSGFDVVYARARQTNGVSKPLLAYSSGDPQNPDTSPDSAIAWLQGIAHFVSVSGVSGPFAVLTNMCSVAIHASTSVW
jgi:hypothetical protein